MIIKLETALLAKEKNFEVPCRMVFREKTKSKEPDDIAFEVPYWEDDIINSEIDFEFLVDNNYICSAPTQEVLTKWFREIHKIDIFVRPFINIETHEKHYKCFVFWFDGKFYQDRTFFSGDIYEEVLELGLKEALNICK